MSDDVLTQVLAGSAAAVFQTTLLQPFEFVKTAAQLRRGIPGIKQQVAIQPVKTYFVGASVLNIGAVLKTGARFGTFEQVCQLIAPPQDTQQAQTAANSSFASMQLAPWQVALAGIITGCVESIWIIPFENVKTRMIENAMYWGDRRDAEVKVTAPKTSTPVSPTFHKATPQDLHPRYKAFLEYEKKPSVGMLNTVVEVYRTRGIPGFLQGSMPTILRQIGNSMVRFTVYTTLKKRLTDPGQPTSEAVAFALGAASSIAVVATTQPLDVVKTRMMSKNAWREYTNALNCCYQIFITEGWVSLYKGAVPRLLKVGLSGGISFGIYQYVENMISQARHDGYLR